MTWFDNAFIIGLNLLSGSVLRLLLHSVITWLADYIESRFGSLIIARLSTRCRFSFHCAVQPINQRRLPRSDAVNYHPGRYLFLLIESCQWKCSEIARKLHWNCSEMSNNLWNLSYEWLLGFYSTALKVLWKCSESALK